MRNGAIAALLVVALLAGAGAGYLGQTSQHSVTSTSIADTSVSTGSPVNITDVESANISIGGSPSAIAVNPGAGRIYIAGGSNVLSVIDAVSHQVVARIALPSSSNSGVSVNYKTGMVYVLVQGGIAVINGTSNEVVGEIAVDFGYRSIAFDSSTDTLFGSPETSAGGLIGVDAETGAIVANLSIGYWANDILVNQQDNMIYAVGCDQQGLVCDSVVSAVNGTSLKLVDETKLDSAYYATATVDEETGSVFVSGESQLVELNASGAIVYESDPDTCGPFLSMTDVPPSNEVVMAPQNYNYLLFYSGQAGKLVGMYSLPGAPQSVAFNPATNETYVIVSESLLSFKGAAGPGSVNEALISSGSCLPP